MVLFFVAAFGAVAANLLLVPRLQWPTLPTPAPVQGPAQWTTTSNLVFTQPPTTMAIVPLGNPPRVMVLYGDDLDAMWKDFRLCWNEDRPERCVRLLDVFPHPGPLLEPVQ